MDFRGLILELLGGKYFCEYLYTLLSGQIEMLFYQITSDHHHHRKSLFPQNPYTLYPYTPIPYPLHPTPLHPTPYTLYPIPLHPKT